MHVCTCRGRPVIRWVPSQHTHTALPWPTVRCVRQGRSEWSGLRRRKGSSPPGHPRRLAGRYGNCPGRTGLTGCRFCCRAPFGLPAASMHQRRDYQHRIRMRFAQDKDPYLLEPCARCTNLVTTVREYQQPAGSYRATKPPPNREWHT